MFRLFTPHDYELFGSKLSSHHFEKHLDKLKRLNWPLERILIVDDSPEKSKQNYGTAIYPNPFEGEQNDDELKYLASYLEKLKDSSNVRKIEKRGWRHFVIPMQW